MVVRSMIVRLFEKTFRRKPKNSKDLKDIEVSEEAESSMPASPVTEQKNTTVIEDCFEDEQLMEFLDLSRSIPIKASEYSQATNAVLKDNAGAVLAEQTLIKYTPSMAYCVVSELSPKVAGKAIKVSEENGDVHKLRLVSIQKDRENRRLLPIFVQVHTVPEERPVEGHLTDRLAEAVLGRNNLELKKNITLDSFACNDTWRDEAGFIVSDRNRFELATFDSSTLIKTLLPSSDTRIVAYTSDELDAMVDFDNTVCGFNREKALEFLAAKSLIYVAKGDSGNIDGLVAGNGEHVFALYAETMEIAHALIKHYINTTKVVQVALFTRCDVWECVPASTRTVFRHHTRAVPGCIKWGKVYAVNMGVHIV